VVGELLLFKRFSLLGLPCVNFIFYIDGSCNNSSKAPGEGFEPSGPLQVTSYLELIPGLRPPRLGDPGSIGSSNHLDILINQDQVGQKAFNKSPH
jgi:hypothetical protein